MSIKIMAQVWEGGPSRQSDRFVLLALADYANDGGECWPSIDSICRKTCLSERGVQSVLRRLEADGWLTIEPGGGRKNCNLYRIETPHHMHPAPYAPPHMDAETPHMDAKNPAPAAPEPSITIIEPSESINARAKPKRKTQIPEDAVLSEKMESIARAEGISQQEAEAQFDRFKGYCIANAKTYASWDAAWRNWLRSPFFKPVTTGGQNGNRPYSAQGGGYAGSGKQTASLASIVARRRNQQR